MKAASVSLILAAIILATGSGCFLSNDQSEFELPGCPEKVGSPSASFCVYRYKINGLAPTALARIDSSNRGRDDILVANSGDSSVSFFRNLNNGKFREEAKFKSCPGSDNVDAENIFGNGFPDFMVSCRATSTLSLFEGDGEGHFQRTDIAIAENPVGAQIAAHVQNPATPYISVLHDSPAELELLDHHGGGNFVRERVFPVPAAPSQMVSDIFTPDGLISYAIASAVNSTFTVYLNTGTTFERQDYLAPEGVAGISAIDLRGSGMVDLVLTSGTRNSFRVYLNDGSGHFHFSREYLVPTGPAGTAAMAHLRGLTRQELVLQSSQTGDIIFYSNLGAGELGAGEVIHVGGNLTGMITGHFIHSSDDMDIAAIDRLRGELVVLLNQRDNF